MKDPREARLVATSLLLALSACIGDIGDSPRRGSREPTGGPVAGTTGDGPAADACAQHDCSNVIDAVIIPKLAASGLALTEEDNAVLCRRMALDLTGLVPTPDEIATQCVGHDAKEMAAYFMTKPTNAVAVDGSAPYVFINRRFWGMRTFAYYPGMREQTWYFYIRELDQIVKDLYSGAIRYDEFAIRALSHPAFLKRFGDFNNGQIDLFKLVGQASRVFLGHEPLPAEAANLANLWRAWSSIQMNEEESFAAYPDCPYDPLAEPGVVDRCFHEELGLDGSHCAGDKIASCQSTVFGPAEVIPETPTFTRYYELSAKDQETIRTPGKLFVARPEFAGAAADLALRKYLAWWKSGVFKPSFDVPEVREALAAKFVADGYDIRKLESEIVTSVLYRQAATRDPSANVPLWAFGPTKIVPAVMWLDNLGPAIGVDFGGYILDGWAPGTYGYYRTAMQNDLGDDGGLVSLFMRRGILEDGCIADKLGVKPDDSPEQMIDRAFVGIGRRATADEKAILLDEIGAADGDGCPDLSSCDRSQLAVALCRSIYAASTFTFY